MTAAVTPKPELKADTNLDGVTVKTTAPPPSQELAPIVVPTIPTLTPGATTTPTDPLKPGPAAPAPPAVLPSPGTATTVATVASIPAPVSGPTSTSADPTVLSGDPAAHLQRLYRLADEAANHLEACTARFERHEQINGKDTPKEIILCKFRKQPFSVAFKWVGEAYKGREVLYVQGQHENKITTHLVAPEDRLSAMFMHSDRVALAPDNSLVRQKSRYPIATSGLWAPVTLFARLLAAQEQGDKRLGSLTYLGLQDRPEYRKKMEAVEHVIPPGAESVLPGGGRRLWFFDPDNHLPLLITTRDAHGVEVEYYCYTDVQPALTLTDDDFNPDKQWPKR
jgi:hypothetical protein